MKKLIFVAIAVFGLTAYSFAQVTTPKKEQTKVTVTKKPNMESKPAVTTTTTKTTQTTKPVTTKTKEQQTKMVKKNGEPDMRYKANKEAADKDKSTAHMKKTTTHEKEMKK
jgi:hypothetical protein